MYRKDQIKGVIALILFGVIGFTYFLSDDEDLALLVSFAAFAVWLISLYFLNRRF